MISPIGMNVTGSDSNEDISKNNNASYEDYYKKKLNDHLNYLISSYNNLH